jgi:hypothetical protein
MDEGGKAWKEWSFAVDDFKQSYYMERWERRDGDSMGKGLILALRTSETPAAIGVRAGCRTDTRDIILVVVGDHFSFARGRNSSASSKLLSVGLEAGNLVKVVDAALERGDREVAEAFLTVEGGHGRISWRSGGRNVEGDGAELATAVTVAFNARYIGL